MDELMSDPSQEYKLMALSNSMSCSAPLLYTKPHGAY